MRTVAIILPFTLLLGCDGEVEHIYERHACASASSSDGSGSDSGSSSAAGSSDEAGSSGAGSTSGEESSGGESTGEPGDGDDIPDPTAPCPTIEEGVVQFCPAGMDTCRNALVYNAAGANGTGPLALHWHGTFESPDGIMAWDSAAQQIQAMVVRENGLMVLPYADPGAPTRVDTPFPWWVVCGSSGTQCNRLDDFILADEIVACTVEQGLVDPNRLTTSGMSAGGTMASHLVDRTSYLAGAVSWSGGVPPAYQPATPENDTALLVMHGGATDAYCGPGALGGTGCYDFRPPSESLAAAAAAAGNFTFLCDHQSGHSASMGLQGAYFLAWSHRVNGHVWEGYPFGVDGGVGTGSSWMLNHYCYVPGEPSPWD
jgi:poly(3-hydroxybutyrate) depolymerase